MNTTPIRRGHLVRTKTKTGQEVTLMVLVVKDQSINGEEIPTSEKPGRIWYGIPHDTLIYPNLLVI